MLSVFISKLCLLEPKHYFVRGSCSGCTASVRTNVSESSCNPRFTSPELCLAINKDVKETYLQLDIYQVDGGGAEQIGQAVSGLRTLINFDRISVVNDNVTLDVMQESEVIGSICVTCRLLEYQSTHNEPKMEEEVVKTFGSGKLLNFSVLSLHGVPPLIKSPLVFSLSKDKEELCSCNVVFDQKLVIYPAVFFQTEIDQVFSKKSTIIFRISSETGFKMAEFKLVLDPNVFKSHLNFAVCLESGTLQVRVLIMLIDLSSTVPTITVTKVTGVPLHVSQFLLRFCPLDNVDEYLEQKNNEPQNLLDCSLVSFDAFGNGEFNLVSGHYTRVLKKSIVNQEIPCMNAMGIELYHPSKMGFMLLAFGALNIKNGNFKKRLYIHPSSRTKARIFCNLSVFLKIPPKKKAKVNESQKLIENLEHKLKITLEKNAQLKRIVVKQEQVISKLTQG